MIKKISFICFFIFISTSFAEDSLQVENPQFVVKIEHRTMDFDSSLDTVNISLFSPGTSFAGFDFKIALLSDCYSIRDIQPGLFYDSCAWEFFNAREAKNKSDTLKDVSVWQIVAISELMPDSVRPLCYSFDDEVPLVHIIIEKIPMTELSDTVLPINFIWEDCSDNTISGQSGNDLFVSNKVVEYFPNKFDLKDNQFPTFNGIPAHCVKKGKLNYPKPAVEFHNGGIIIEYSFEDDSLILHK